MLNNSAAQGGAIYAMQSAQLVIFGSELAHNSAVNTPAKSTGAATMPRIGGAICALGWGLVEIHSSNITGNVAMQGGGIQAEGNVTLRLGVDVHVTGNVAGGAGVGSLSGGGGFALSTRDFDPSAVVQAAQGNIAFSGKTANVLVQLLRIAVANNTQQLHVVSRLGANDGVVMVTVNTTGAFGLPVPTQILADLEGRSVTNVETGDDGLGVLIFKLRQQPGPYNLTIWSRQRVLPAVLQIVVLDCPVGDVTASSGDACITCVAGTFSFNPQNNTCDDCPLNAGLCRACPTRAH
jgi:predicted outer membrane repeat protein